MSSSSVGVDLTANGIAHQTAECACEAGVAVCAGEAVSQAPVKSNLINGPETDPHFHRQEIVEQDGDSPAVLSVRKCNDHFSGPVAKNQLGEQSKAQANSILSSKEVNIGKKNKLTINDKMCLCEGGMRKDFRLARPGSNVSENADDKEIIVDTSSKISKLKSNMANTSEAASVNVKFDGLTNGCCDSHVKGEMSNTSQQGKAVSVSCTEEQSKIENTASYTATNRQSLDKLICNCTDTTISEPLSDLTRMVENVCLDGESSQDVKFASSTEKLKSETSQGSPCEQGATCGDLLGGIDQPFGVIGPAGAEAGANLEDAELEELPSSLSDFVLGCPSSQYTVPPCPLSDSDINTIHIRSQTGSDEHPVTLVPYKSEVQMPDIMRLITKDLSEPYSIYTYRYFIHNWPQLCFLAMHRDKCVGAIVCKLDVHKKMARRGYIAMLAVDENYRKLQIGSSLVKKAIRAMVRGECDEVVLETEITNKPALKLYENLGFLRDKRLFRYYLNGVDALRLKLWLR